MNIRKKKKKKTTRRRRGETLGNKNTARRKRAKKEKETPSLSKYIMTIICRWWNLRATRQEKYTYMHIGNVMLCTTSRCGVLLALYVDVFSFSFDVEKKQKTIPPNVFYFFR
jgi:hypothetical protein